MLAGFLRGEPVELVQCTHRRPRGAGPRRDRDRGLHAKGELADEGPFGDHTGYYTPAEPFPVLHVTAMTMRRDPIYPSIIVGVPPPEDAWLGKADRAPVPAGAAHDPARAGRLRPAGRRAPSTTAIVSIRKAFPGHARKVMHAVWGTGLLSLTKGVVVVDDWVDVHDYGQVMWQVGANVDPARDVLLSDGPLDHLDHAPARQFMGGKIGIDATAKLEAEGYAREWPEVIRMSDEVRALVDGRWAEYGVRER